LKTDWAESLRGAVAILSGDSAHDGGVGAGIAMASHVLRLQDGYGLIYFFRCFGLFSPDAVVLAGISPSDYFRCNHVWHSAARALAVHDVKVTRCRLRVWRLKWFVSREIATFTKLSFGYVEFLSASRLTKPSHGWACAPVL